MFLSSLRWICWELPWWLKISWWQGRPVKNSTERARPSIERTWSRMTSSRLSRKPCSRRWTEIVWLVGEQLCMWLPQMELLRGSWSAAKTKRNSSCYFLLLMGFFRFLVLVVVFGKTDPKPFSLSVFSFCFVPKNKKQRSFSSFSRISVFLGLLFVCLIFGRSLNEQKRDFEWNLATHDKTTQKSWKNMKIRIKNKDNNPLATSNFRASTWNNYCWLCLSLLFFTPVSHSEGEKRFYL